MCGICGCIATSANDLALENIVVSMSRTLAHRGPDGDGIFVSKAIAFGHRRLSIIDIEGGFQPMHDDRGYVITYNGELYNFLEIRQELEKLGEQFKTHSDTEVLLKAYIRWGKECLPRLNGMFAFAIANINDGSIFAARDRLGIKPLYYAQSDKYFVFSSEIKAFRFVPDLNREISLSQIPFYLSYGYYPNGHTPYKNVHQLQPGHWLEYSSQQLTTGCYWNLDQIVAERGIHRATASSDEQLLHLLSDAIRMQTISDVPIGTFLSGGLDSGIVSSFLSEQSDDPISTFTVAIGDTNGMDESQIAKTMASRWGTNHYQIQLRADDLLQHWQFLFDQFDQPFADTSALPTYLISKFARSHVKVILSGDGGDEQWGGYGTYRRQLQIQTLRKLLPFSWMHQLISASARTSAEILSGRQPYFASRLNYYADLLNLRPDYLHARLDRHMSAELIRQVSGEQLRDQLAGLMDPEEAYASDPELGVDGAMLRDIKTFMVDDVLRKVDMMSMACGLEVRVPLLDHRLVEHSACISWHDKVSLKDSKILIRRLLRNRLPKSVIKGSKRGFSVPLDQWFRGPLKQFMGDTLSPSRCNEHRILEPHFVSKLIHEHLSERRNHGKTLFTLIALQRWLDSENHVAH